MTINLKNKIYLTSIILCILSQSAFARDKMQIVGSSTVYPFSTMVAERLGSKGNFKTPVVESTGTGGGFQLFCSGVGESHPDISNASRAIKDTEYSDCQTKGVKEIIEVKFGNDGIVFANNRKAKKMNFTLAQIWQAMSAKGKLPKMWNEIDPSLPAMKIEILTPPPTSGTRDAWNELVMEQGCDEKIKAVNKKDCQLMREDGPVVEAGENDALIVQKLSGNNEAFGIFGFSYFDANQDQLQASSIMGIEPKLESIQAYEYAISRPLYFYVKKAHIGAVPGIKEFLDAFVSESAIGDEGYLLDAGLIPLTSEQRANLRSDISTMKIYSK